VLVRTRIRFRAAADFLTWVPQTLPGIILTLAWFWIILKTPFLRPLYGSLWALIVVSAVGGMTLSVQVLKANVMQLGTDLEESSEISGASWFRTLTRVVIQLLMPTLVVVWVLNYVFTASSAVTPALLASAGSKPLALLQLEYLIGEERGPASVVGVVLLVTTMSVAVVARMFGFRIGLGRNS
jgi:iron(III) transport system permease protein